MSIVTPRSADTLEASSSRREEFCLCERWELVRGRREGNGVRLGGWEMGFGG